MNYLADKSYLAVKPQTAPGTPVIATKFFPLISESIRVNPNFVADRRLKGLDWKSDELLKGPRMIEGELEIYADADALAHVLNMLYDLTGTTGDASVGYTHSFAPGEGQSYSIEIPRGDFVQRIWGARADNLKLEFRDNKLVAVVSVKALGQFYTASLAVALTGPGMTSAVLKTDYDLRPTDGLKVGDMIRVGGVDVTLTSVNANGTTVGFASTSITASIGDPVFLLAQTPTFGTAREPLYFGNSLVGVGATESAATTAAGAKATATPCYNFSANFKNNLLDAPASGSTGPSVLLNQVKEADVEISRLFENPTQYQKWIEFVKQAVTFIATGRFIKSDFTTSEKLTVKYHKVKLVTNEEPLEVGAYIFDRQKFEALYDSGDAKAVAIELIDRVAPEELDGSES